MQGTLDKEVLNPAAKPLSPEELKFAIRDNICVHREFIKSHFDPTIPSQQAGVVAFKFLENPLMLPDNELFYGWYKVRNACSNEAEAQTFATELLKTHDSKTKNRIIPIGHWVPLTSSKLFTKQFNEFSDQSFRQNIIDSENREKEAVKEIRAREEKLTKGISQFDENSIDYYIMKKVTLAENEHTMERAVKTVKETRRNISELTECIEKLDAKFPGYKNESLSVYNKERRDAGLEQVSSFNFKALAKAQ